ncbi:tRNA 4-thiouridine(8) synthase ThiI [Candidatus Calescamantes bacterium]|nr:tRNA 4-thiouridine(8) synthase ThiI [Candidatus Calescamantes bacterium]
MGKPKAVALVSGGLDSILAVYLVKLQGVEVIGVNFHTPFLTLKDMEKVREFLGIPFKEIFLGEEMIEVIKNPCYGYGQGMNPCIDCRILMLKKAKEIMEEVGAEFVITGEVLGQRPMSQRREVFPLMEREAGLEKRVLRPLSAKLLPPTIPEEEGWIKREELLDIQGRGRKIQLALAEKIGLTNYSSPAGGCLLTDPIFSRRLKDLMEKNPNFGLKEVELLKVGRHFRLPSGKKLIVGRNREENRKLLSLAGPEDYLLQEIEGKGAVVFLSSPVDEEELLEGGAIAAFYSKKRSWELVEVKWKRGKEEGRFWVEPERKGRMI